MELCSPAHDSISAITDIGITYPDERVYPKERIISEPSPSDPSTAILRHNG